MKLTFITTRAMDFTYINEYLNDMIIAMDLMAYLFSSLRLIHQPFS
jgi:hypothetical protein